ncbi:MAG: RagB/SusD family nutrient uptake outer membrane protein [Gemmatimonadetes bacterium]|nr:RagB/SusD family nutrient uptake outer membrane protein [Gemmatimonadota bacterium]MBT8404782.1 RagB/SusD family nutrient uptake outer membrane protein [Gemmatimonadota bacterium]NNF39621.1 RagB/SusD family nutrient uptake outer membrane protein [Gemmatimonadota bacterium]NNK64320.1 RagB/SusD family nutrient uptake outer membrane protein [Gemmatimonadota bacterium]
MNNTIKKFLTLSLTLPALACSEVLTLDVEAPGRINDGDLNTPDAIPGIISGMSYDLSQAIDGALQDIALASGDLWHSGSYDFGTYPRGILLQEPEDWDGEFGSFQQARWVAEDGLRRIAGILEPDAFERNADVARGYLLAGFANRWLGEVQCSSTIDGGPEVPRTEHFNRADSLFSRAISVGGASGANAIVEAAYGGRASIRAWLGNWAQAALDAQQVGAGFEYVAVFSTVSGAIENDLVFETNNRREFTVFNTIWETQPQDDPRVPWEIPLDNAGQVLKGQDGETDFYRQLKYLDQDADVPLTHGPEMLILRAEAALRDGSVGQMTGLINQARAEYGLDPIAEPATVADAWPVLRFERAAVLWLEGRRLWDLHRWEAEGGAVADPFSQGRDTCFPISDEERRVNPNLS